MGPFSELKQLERKASVLRILQQGDLSEWARNYWGRIYDTIAMNEDRYNARVVTTFKNAKRGDIEYE
jgi:hypothetical protein